MLRLILGDSVFFKAARQYLKDPAVAYGFARTEDLKRNLEQVSGKNLDAFFDDWYTGQGYPSYNVQWTQLGSEFVRIKLNQASSHNSVVFFELPVPLKFKNATQEKTIVLENSYNGEIFIRQLGFRPDTVLIDPEYWLITRNNTATRVTEPTTGQNILQVYPNPVGNQFYVYLRNFSTPNAVVQLLNGLGQLVYSRKINFINGSEFIQINSTRFPSGMYELRIITSDGQIVTRKLIK
jgi:aminopeptidase N